MQLTRRRLSLLAAVLVVAALFLPALGANPTSGYAASLLRSTPADAAAKKAPCRSYSAAATAEEKLRGTTSWQPTRSEAPILGYLDHTTARCGEEVRVHLSGPGPAELAVYRVGWYGGTGARLVWTSDPVGTSAQGPLSVDPETSMGEARWPVSTAFNIPARWPPGVYLVVVRPAGTSDAPGAGAVMPLVIPEQRVLSPLLAVASTLTWAAYNDAGGSNTYHGPAEGSPAATRASFDRPLTGSGLRHLLVYDLPLVRFLGRARLSVGWTTDDELDRLPSVLDGHAGLVFPGHSEYWTARMYDAVEGARNQGVNVAFLGANPVYWQTRLTASPLGSRRRMLIYRDLDADPVARATPARATVRWRDVPLSRDEAELVGTTYAYSGVHAGMRITDGPDWLLAGTGRWNGSYLVAVAANEVDRLSDAKMSQPPNLQVVLRGAFATPSGIVRDFAATYYSSPGGAAVFAAGTTAWPCGLERSCPWGPVPGDTSRAMQRMTANLLHAFSQEKFGLLHPSVPSQLLPLPAFWHDLPPSVRGTGDVHEPDGLNED